MKTLPTTMLLWALTWSIGQAFPIPLPSPVPANETPFANLQPGQHAVLGDWTKHPDEGIRTYSGTVTYQTTFNKTAGAGPFVLDLGNLAP